MSAHGVVITSRTASETLTPTRMTRRMAPISPGIVGAMVSGPMVMANSAGPGTKKIDGMTTMPAKNGMPEPDALDEEVGRDPAGDGRRQRQRVEDEQHRVRAGEARGEHERQEHAELGAWVDPLEEGRIRAWCSVKIARSMFAEMPARVCSTQPIRAPVGVARAGASIDG